MTRTNKVLTVSYGTFSCTLEGYRDPVETVRKLVAHFRELLEKDPSFGADLAGRKNDGPSLPDKIAAHLAHGAETDLAASDHVSSAHNAESEVESNRIDVPPKRHPAISDRVDKQIVENALVSQKDGKIPKVANAERLQKAMSKTGGSAIQTKDDAPTPIARVVKLKKRTFEAALAAGELEEVDDGTSPDPISEQFSDTTHGDPEKSSEDDDLSSNIREIVGASGLNAKDEDALVTELAEVQKDARAQRTSNAEAASTPRFHKVPVTPFVPTDTDADLNPSPTTEERSDTALDRLMDKTAQRMGDAGSNRRREAIAHLKVAVAATMADNGIRDSRHVQGVQAIDRFRNDLKQTIVPKQPADVSNRNSTESATPPLNPLVLASSQRIDGHKADAKRSHTATARRDAATEIPTQSFAKFAARQGAQDVEDHIEAAAAYAQAIQGQRGANRRAISRRAASAMTDEFSREDMLRAFTAVLQNGRLRNLGYGQFAVCSRSRFLPAEQLQTADI